MESSWSCPKPKEYLSHYDENYCREMELNRRGQKRSFTVHLNENESSECGGFFKPTSSIVKKARVCGQTPDRSEMTHSTLFCPSEQKRINALTEKLNAQRISPESLQPTVDQNVISAFHEHPLRNAQSCPNLAACLNSTFHVANNALSFISGKNGANGGKKYSIEPPSRTEYKMKKEVFTMIPNNQLLPRTSSLSPVWKDVSCTVDANMLMETD